MATPAIQSTQTSTGTLGSITITKPVSLAQNDLMIASVAARATGGTWTPPAGWTQVEAGGPGGGANFPYTAIFRKLAGASEAANYTFTHSSSVNCSGEITRITGVDTLNPVDSHSSSQNGSAQIIQCGTASPTMNSNLILLFTSNPSTVAPATYAATNVASFTVQYNDTVASDPNRVTMAYGTSTASGSTTGTADLSITSAVSFGAILSIKSPNTVAPSIFGSTFSFSGFTIGEFITVIVSMFGSLFHVNTPSSVGPVSSVWTPTSKGTADTWTPTPK